MPRVELCDQESLASGEFVRVEIKDLDAIAVINIDDEIYAIADKCSHGDWPLSDGYVENGEVECSLHMGRFCLKTGKAMTPPACEAVKVYPVSVIDKKVFVDI